MIYLLTGLLVIVIIYCIGEILFDINRHVMTYKGEEEE